MGNVQAHCGGREDPRAVGQRAPVPFSAIQSTLARAALPAAAGDFETALRFLLVLSKAECVHPVMMPGASPAAVTSYAYMRTVDSMEGNVNAMGMMLKKHMVVPDQVAEEDFEKLLEELCEPGALGKIDESLADMVDEDEGERTEEHVKSVVSKGACRAELAVVVGSRCCDVLRHSVRGGFLYAMVETERLEELNR